MSYGEVAKSIAKSRFRVRGKGLPGIQPAERWLTASLDAAGAGEWMRRHPEAREEIWRSGDRFMGLRVDLAALS